MGVPRSEMRVYDVHLLLDLQCLRSLPFHQLGEEMKIVQYYSELIQIDCIEKNLKIILFYIERCKCA